MGKNRFMGRKKMEQRAKRFAGGFKASGGRNDSGFKRSLGKPGSSRKWMLEMNLSIPDWKSMNLEEIKKDFYQEHPLVKDRNEAAIKEHRERSRISVRGHDCPKPVQAFDECNFSESIMSALKVQNFVTPTPIQSQALPVALSGRDMVGIAETGSGKTLAYILPAITHIHGKDHRRNVGEPDVVILAPTRELAQQIHQVVVSLGPGVKVTSECFYGGTKRAEQKVCAEKVFEICIATPGRLVDFLYEELVKLHKCTYFVLDEADRMLDMGFEPQIKMVINQARPDRQMLMFSATWPPEIRNLAEKYLKDYILVNVGSLEISANHNITQKIEICEESDKPQRIVKIMKNVMEQKEKKTLIFVNSKVDVDLLTLKFRLNGWAALGLHGNKKQTERDQVFGDFKTGKIFILIATDLAARGLDVDDVKFIINYDYPKCSEDYVHRIGRTARCNRTGTAITFFTQQDRSKAEDLISVLEEAGQYVSPELQNLANLPPMTKEGKKALKPKGMKSRKSQLKRLVTKSEINHVPLGTTTNTETLPDLDDILDPLIMANTVPGKKNKQKKLRRLQISQLMAAVAHKQQVSNPPMKGHPSNMYKWTKDNANSQTPRPVSDIGLSMPNENFQVNSNMPPVMQKSQESFMQGNVQNMQHFNENRYTDDVVGNGKRSMFPMSGQVNRQNSNLGMNSRDSYQQQGMAPNFGMSFDNASMTADRRRNEGFLMDARNTGMATGNRNAGVPMDHRNSGSSWGARNMGMHMDPRNSILSQNQSGGSMGWPGVGSSAHNYMGRQDSNWGNYKNNYGLNQADMNRYSVQNTWSGSGYNQYPGRYGTY